MSYVYYRFGGVMVQRTNLHTGYKFILQISRHVKHAAKNVTVLSATTFSVYHSSCSQK